MSDTSTNTPPPPPATPPTPSHEQLAALVPFQNQLAWVGSEQYNRGIQQGAKDLVEKLGMTVEEAVEKLKAADQPPSAQQPPAGQGQPNADLERRVAELEQRAKGLDERETKLNERETTLKKQEQDGFRVAALKELGMTDAQAATAKSMLPLPAGVTELTPELAKASAAQLKDTFPALFVPPPAGDGQQPGGGNGNSGGQPSAGGPPPDTHTRGTSTQGAAGGGSGQSADDRAKARLASRGHVRPQQS